MRSKKFRDTLKATICLIIIVIIIIFCQQSLHSYRGHGYQDNLMELVCEIK